MKIRLDFMRYAVFIAIGGLRSRTGTKGVYLDPKLFHVKIISLILMRFLTGSVCDHLGRDMWVIAALLTSQVSAVGRGNWLILDESMGGKSVSTGICC